MKKACLLRPQKTGVEIHCQDTIIMLIETVTKKTGK